MLLGHWVAADRMCQLPPGEDSTSDEGLTSGEEQHAMHRCRPLKSGVDRMGATMMIHNIKTTSPSSKVIYSPTRKRATYKDLLVPAFVQGYLIVMANVDTKTRDIMAKHLEELISDCVLYK